MLYFYAFISLLDTNILSVSNEDLFQAIDYVRTLGTPLQELHYTTSQGDILLGDVNNDNLEGTDTQIATGTPYGNLGGPIIYNDTLIGGSGKDTYIVNPNTNDLIIDTNTKDVKNANGMVEYDGYALSDAVSPTPTITNGSTLTGGVSNTYIDSNNDTFTWNGDGNDLIVTGTSSINLTIKNFSNGDLGITLSPDSINNPQNPGSGGTSGAGDEFSPSVFNPPNSPATPSHSPEQPWYSTPYLINYYEAQQGIYGLYGYIEAWMDIAYNYYNIQPDPNGPAEWVPNNGIYNLAKIALNFGSNLAKLMEEAVKGAYGPLILDLTGDGISTTSLNTSNNYFDFNGSGFAKKTAWIGSNNGILTIDNNGTTTTINNFQTLAQLDSDSNGVIDANDSTFSQLRIIKGDGSICTLSDLGIQSLNLTNTADNTTDANGNTRVAIGSYTLTNGTTLEMSDYSLMSDPFYSVPDQTLHVPDDIAILPNAIGTGNTYSLRQAMVRDTSGELQTLVQEFMHTDTQEARSDLVDQILYQWTNCEKVDPTSRGIYDARKLDVIESFAGQNLAATITDPNEIPQLDKAYYAIKQEVYSDNGGLRENVLFLNKIGKINANKLAA